MALEMRSECERCETALAAAGRAFICSHECTFFSPCSAAMEHRCPNCGDKLVRRLRREGRSD